MKKWLMLIGLLVVVLLGILFYPKEPIATAPKSHKLIEYNGPEFTTVTGRSMEPTIHSGDKVYIERRDPVVNDVVSLHCSKPECLNYKGEEHYGTFVKRLIKVRDDGAWWILGDNPDVSFDSRYFGWVLPSERSDVYVIKLNSQNQ